MRLAVSGRESQGELRAVAETLIRDRLEQVDGMASAAVMGDRTKQVMVNTT